MFPVLVEIGPLTLHTYGLFIAAGYLAGLAYAWWDAKRHGLEPGLALDIGFWAFIGAIVGARGLYVLLTLDYYLDNPLQVFMFWEGGLVFSGGALLAALAVYILVRSRGAPPLAWGDVLAPGLALGQAIGRFGCLFAGCCYGETCDLPWAITFYDTRSLAPLYVDLHPTQIYHSLAGLVTFLVLFAVRDRFSKHGVILGLYLLLYSVFRFTIEFYRGDWRGSAFGVLSVTQVIVMALFVVGLWLVFRKGHDKT